MVGPRKGGGPTERLLFWDFGGGRPLGGSLDHLANPRQPPLGRGGREVVPPDFIRHLRYISVSTGRGALRRSSSACSDAPGGWPEPLRVSGHGPPYPLRAPPLGRRQAQPARARPRSLHRSRRDQRADGVRGVPVLRAAARSRPTTGATGAARNARACESTTTPIRDDRHGGHRSWGDRARRVVLAGSASRVHSGPAVGHLAGRPSPGALPRLSGPRTRGQGRRRLLPGPGRPHRPRGLDGAHVPVPGLWSIRR